MTGTDARADEFAAALEPSLPGRVERDAPLAGLTTYRVGGSAEVLVRARREGDLAVVAAALHRFPQPLLIVGRGSNLLVADAGFPGLVLLLEGEFEEITPAGATVQAGGAVALPVLARRAAAAGLAGLEFYVGIPGTVGGAIRMNAGGHGQETREVLTSARIVDLLGDGLARGPDRPCARARVPQLGAATPRGGGGRVVHRHHRRAGCVRSADRRDRALATRAPARRRQRRVGVPQPAR